MNECRPSTANDFGALATRLGALSHPARLRILTHLAQQNCCSCCKDVVSQLDLAQSTVSQHLKVLVESGLVKLTPDGTRSLYEIDRGAFASLSESVGGLLSACCAGPCDTQA
ncbi:MAG: winged helix-turn-helix transcriptional regulator [Rhizobiaceae bacterium]|nr:winged helix-turn-helix transcriptional regulator [Rhizobiaceae bacterium]